MRLSEIDPEENNLEEVITWGTRPILTMAKMMDMLFDESTDEQGEDCLYLLREIQEKLKDMEECLTKFHRHYTRKEEMAA